MIRHKAASYAVAAMLELAKKRADQGATETSACLIAERLGLPVSYTAKILSQLAKASLLKSDRGPHGGYALGRSAADITVFEIFDAVGAVDREAVTLPAMISSGVQSKLDGLLDRLGAEFRHVLSQMTLHDLTEASAAPGAGSPTSERLISADVA